jgi:hypothetical protein
MITRFRRSSHSRLTCYFQSPLKPAQGQVSTATQVTSCIDAETTAHPPSVGLSAPLLHKDIPAAVLPSAARQVSFLSMNSACPESMQVSMPYRSLALSFPFLLPVVCRLHHELLVSSVTRLKITPFLWKSMYVRGRVMTCTGSRRYLCAAHSHRLNRLFTKRRNLIPTMYCSDAEVRFGIIFLPRVLGCAGSHVHVCHSGTWNRLVEQPRWQQMVPRNCRREKGPVPRVVEPEQRFYR